MRHLLAASALIGLSLAAVSPAEAKSVWLKCGDQEINLDSSMERFSLTYINKVYQGRATFNPGQIDFEFIPTSVSGSVSTKHVYSIDRKSLKYTDTRITRVFFTGFDSGWETDKTTNESPNPTIGKCSIMKTQPTAGNQI